jgi:transcriptional regulator with XRE-family HTH domain
MEFDALRGDFGARLTQERRRLGRSQADLARTAQITKTTQLAYEQGSRLPGLDYLLRVSASGLDLWFLLWGTPHKLHVIQSLDWDLLGEIHEAMDQWLLDNDLSITPRKRIELSRLIYELGLAKDGFDLEDVRRVLKLAA